MLKFLALSSSCKTFCGSVRAVKTRKSAGKPDVEWLVREGIVKSNPEKSSGSLSSPAPELKQNEQAVSPPLWFACLLLHRISALIHLARCVKFNPSFNPWIVLIELRGTEFNRGINLFPGLGRFNLELALIGFQTNGAWTTNQRCYTDLPFPPLPHSHPASSTELTRKLFHSLRSKRFCAVREQRITGRWNIENPVPRSFFAPKPYGNACYAG